MLLSEIGSVFHRVRETHSDCVRCQVGCTDCCYAVFELFPIEAAYLSYHFQQHLKRKERREVLRRAEKALLEIARVKEGIKDKESEVLQMAEARIRCPLLSDQGRCLLYEYRPITCRLYGIPTAIRGAGHTCGKSGFEKGTVYPTVNLDLIHEKLFTLSVELWGAHDYRQACEEARKLMPVPLALKMDL
ncbi:MAG: YkgJ family cysteine cluster protein [Thermodesulfobacteriota bacterium]|nr:YkgJ family cysteine cluster protein [Thermodesulfobacteriota bacterium]